MLYGSSGGNLFLPALPHCSCCYDFPDSQLTARRACSRLYRPINIAELTEKPISGQGVYACMHRMIMYSTRASEKPLGLCSRCYSR